MNMDNKKIALDEANEMTLVSLSTEASTLTNGNGDSWPEAWNPAYKVH
jgi:hypothetical protein